MLTIEQIQEQLDDRRLYAVAAASGVSYQTLWKIARRKHKNVTLSTVRKLSNYLERNAKIIIEAAR